MGHRLSQKVTIIGSGIMGLCTAYYARQRGFEVTILERGSEGDDNCSSGNAGMIVPSHFVPLAAPGMVGMGIKMMMNPQSPFAFKMPPSVDQLLWSWQFMRHANAKHVAESEVILRDLNLKSRSLYEAMTEDLGIGVQMVKRGLLMLCQQSSTLESEAHLAARANELGVKATVLDLAGVQALDKKVTMDVAGGVHFQDDCHLTPHLLLAALKNCLMVGGVQIVFDTTVSEIKKAGDKLQLSTNMGSMEADQVVIAGGVYSKPLAKSIGLNLPMMAGKGYSIVLDSPPETPRLCSILMEARVAVTPMQHGLRFGGTMELGEPTDDINADRLKGIIDSIPQYFPKFKSSDFEGKPVWHGHRPCSPDGLPYVGRIKTTPNVIVATGHSMMGLSLGPVTGKLVSEILANESTTLPINQLDPNRYA